MIGATLFSKWKRSMIKRELPGVGEREKEGAAVVQPQRTTLFHTISSNRLTHYTFIEGPVCS
jgi:hypothetical protein